MTRKRVNITAVAQRSGFSVSAVSQALNNKGRIGAEARARILEAAAELGYAPDPRATSLRTGRSRIIAIQATLGVRAAAISASPYFMRLVNAAAAEALSLGWTLVLLSQDVSEAQLRQIGVETGIVVDPIGGESLLLGLAGLGGVIVTDGRFDLPPGFAPHPDARFATLEYRVRDVVRAALDHALEMGYRRPALLTSGARTAYAQDAVAAFGALCRERGLPHSVARTSGPDVEDAIELTQAMLAEDPRPDFIFATTVNFVLGALYAANEAGVPVPDQLGLMTSSEAPILSCLRPAIAAIDLQPEATGRRLVHVALSLAESSPASPGFVQDEPLGFHLVARRSTARDAACPLDPAG